MLPPAASLYVAGASKSLLVSIYAYFGVARVIASYVRGRYIYTHIDKLSNPPTSSQITPHMLTVTCCWRQLLGCTLLAFYLQRST
jgi:hypothetical protein